MLSNMSKNLREIVGQYSSPESVAADEKGLLMLRFKAVLQHYLWFHKDTQHAEAKKLYRKLSIYFHPDKFDNDINQAEPDLLQKQDIIKIASFFKAEDDNQGKDGFFKIISDVYTGKFDSSLASLEQALVKPTVSKPTRTETSTTSTHTYDNTDHHHSSHSSANNAHYHRHNQRPRYRQHHYQQQYRSQNQNQPKYDYNHQQWSDWGQEYYKSREYTEAELFEFLEKHLTTAKNIDIENYIKKLTLEKILNKFIQDKNYFCLENVLHFLYRQKRLESNCLNELLDRAMQYQDIELAKLAIHYGATTVESIYKEAIKKYNDQALYVLFEALPNEHVLKYGSIASLANSEQLDFYYLNKMCSAWLINPYTFARLSQAQKLALNCYEIYDFISNHKVPVLKILSLSVEELQLIQYPGFNKLFIKLGDFDRALGFMKRKRAILNQPIIRELASRGIQRRYQYQHGYNYYGYAYDRSEPVNLDYLLSLGEKHIDNLNNQNVITLIKAGIINLNEGVFFDERQKELLKYSWLREEMSSNTRSYPLDILNHVYHLKDEEIKLINTYIQCFPFLQLNTFFKLSAEDKEKLASFMPILNNYCCVTQHRNGYAFFGLNFNHILRLSADKIKKLTYSFSPELYFNQGEMGKYLLEHFPVSFFEENKNAKLKELFNQALFYACQNDMPEFINLYTQNYNDSENDYMLSSLFKKSKNCLNLYTLTNQKKQTLEEIALENNAAKAVECIKNNTYYFDWTYQNTCRSSAYLKEMANSLVRNLMARIVP